MRCYKLYYYHFCSFDWYWMLCRCMDIGFLSYMYIPCTEIKLILNWKFFFLHVICLYDKEKDHDSSFVLKMTKMCSNFFFSQVHTYCLTLIPMRGQVLSREFQDGCLLASTPTPLWAVQLDRSVVVAWDLFGLSLIELAVSKLAFVKHVRMSKC